ncbi:hypothetical protein IFM89_022271 [Coptis chinensis]|uniref:Uncharacterized protein n=1 Tax=Coptis chinensis TaxID=261450 RepID=A0A835ICS9_9MAGN|nr:hypothetical protein IFM89_022271 [Coptis chinensis]
MPLPDGVRLINFDASFRKGSSYAHIAVIGRNSDGEYLKGKVSKVRASTPGELSRSLGKFNNIGRRSSLKAMQRGLCTHVKILMQFLYGPENQCV